MIDTNALRVKIIEAAIQGLLTEREDDDDDTGELVERIEAKRLELQKLKIIKKTKPLAPVTEDEIPFAIPKTWVWVKFGNVISLKSGQDLNKSAFNADGAGLPYLTGASNVDDDGRLIINRWTTQPKCIAKRGDLLITCKGTVGKLAILDEDEAHIARQFMAITMIGFNVDYARIFMDAIISGLKARQKGLIPGIERNDILNLCFPLPSLAEQKRIVARVSELLNYVDAIEDAQLSFFADAEVLRAKIIDAGMRGFLSNRASEDSDTDEQYQLLVAEKERILRLRRGRADRSIKPIDENTPFNIPSHWKWIRFGEVGLFKKGPFGSALTKSMFVPKSVDTVKVYEQQHAIQRDHTLGRYYITRDYFESKMAGFEVMPGDIIVSCAGTIGETYILPNDIEQGIINQALMRITLAPSIDRRFFQYFFDSNLKKSAQSESNGTAINNIPPFDVLKNWYFPMPPIEEQRRIAQRIDELLTALPE